MVSQITQNTFDCTVKVKNLDLNRSDGVIESLH